MGCMRSGRMGRPESVWQMKGLVNAKALCEEKEVRMAAARRSR